VIQPTLFETLGVAPSPESDFPDRAATLCQPWAWLVAQGLKPTENRPRGFWKFDFRGWFWIHAGLERSEKQWLSANALARQHGGVEVPTLDDPRLVYGAIIGKARVVDMLPKPALCELPNRWRMAGKFGYVLEDAMLLRRPVPCRGYQGFWRVPEEVKSMLRDAA